MRALTLPALAAAAAALSATAALADAKTVRIEPRPFYGATVTLEEGVRVFRPLPPHDRVIINPGSKTPLSLGYYESHNYNTNYNYDYSDGFYGPYYGNGAFGFVPGHGHAKRHRPGHKGHFGHRPGGKY